MFVDDTISFMSKKYKTFCHSKWNIKKYIWLVYGMANKLSLYLSLWILGNQNIHYSINLVGKLTYDLSYQN